MAGKLYIVPTPVGNLEDMTPRAVRVLNTVSLILAEDTRTSAPLLKHFGIFVPLSSYHKFNEHQACNSIVNRLLEGQDVALISDAGTPGVSDPGFLLSRECRRHDIEVETLPGATAFVPALINSGLPCERFIFQGFLPIKKGRMTRMQEIADSPVTSILYESPLRVGRTLKELSDVCGAEREASLSREISKKFEQTLRGTLCDLSKHFEINQPKGEFVIIVGPRPESSKKEHINKYKPRTE